MIKWNFPSNGGGVISGISDAGIETFKGTPYKALAREICQNSLDARKSSDYPVKVEFGLIKIQSNEIPGYCELINVIENCKDYWTENNNKKAMKFFDKAIDTINNHSINVLRISDYNTLGLEGSDKEVNSSWSNLVKGNGVSNKEGGAGGSFGIGKSAPFACSDLRTVFYSTKDNNSIMAYQGVSRLASCRMNGYITQGTGYYGDENLNMPVKEMIHLDKNYSRTETGTDIFILGFNKEEYWKEQMISSILDGFLVAIWSGLLEVIIEDVNISKDTLSSIVNQYDNYISVNVKNYYNALISSKTITKEWNFNGLGNVKLMLLEGQGFCRKVLISRKSGMKIFEQDRLSSYIEFAGILILEGEDVNSFFRDMETPEHNKWQPKRSDNKNAEKYKKQLYQTIKKYVNELQNVNDNETLEIEGLGDYIADEALGNNDNITEEIQNKIKTFTSTRISTNKNKSRRTSKGNGDYEDIFGDIDKNGEDIYGDHLENKKSKNGNAFIDGSANLDSDKKIKKEVRLEAINTRIFCDNKINNEYKLIFNVPNDIKEGCIKLNILGEQGETRCNILCATDSTGNKLKIEHNKIYINKIHKSEKQSLKVKINYDNYCALGVDIYGFSE